MSKNTTSMTNSAQNPLQAPQAAIGRRTDELSTSASHTKGAVQEKGALPLNASNAKIKKKKDVIVKKSLPSHLAPSPKDASTLLEKKLTPRNSVPAGNPERGVSPKAPRPQLSSEKLTPRNSVPAPHKTRTAVTPGSPLYPDASQSDFSKSRRPKPGVPKEALLASLVTGSDEKKSTSNIPNNQDILAEIREARARAAAMLAERTKIKNEAVQKNAAHLHTAPPHTTSTPRSDAEQKTQDRGRPIRNTADTSHDASQKTYTEKQGSRQKLTPSLSPPLRAPQDVQKPLRLVRSTQATQTPDTEQKAANALQHPTEEKTHTSKKRIISHGKNEKKIIASSKNTARKKTDKAQKSLKAHEKSNSTRFSKKNSQVTLLNDAALAKLQTPPPTQEHSTGKQKASVKLFNHNAPKGSAKEGNIQAFTRDIQSKKLQAAKKVGMSMQNLNSQQSPIDETEEVAFDTVPTSIGNITGQKENSAHPSQGASSNIGQGPSLEKHPSSVPFASGSSHGTASDKNLENQSPTDSIPQVPPMPVAPADVDFIPHLLRSLSSLLRLRGKSISPQFLYAGLAGVGEVTPGECMRAAARAGLQARIMFRPLLEDISPMTLPCILLLEGNRSCLLTALSHNVATVVFPEMGEDPQQVSQESILKEYTGYAVFGSVEKQADKRIDSFRRPKGKRWFWDAIKHYGPIYRHAAFASIIINLIALGSPLFVMNVYDRVVPNNAIDTLWVLAMGITLAYLFDFMLRTLRNHFVDTAGRNADVVISSMLVDKVLTMQLDHKPESTGALVNNVREFESLREFFSSSTLLSCIDLPFLFLFVLCLSFIGGSLVILPLVAMPIMFGAGIILQALAKRAAEKSYSQNMHKNALLTEIVNGLETLKCCQGENRMQRMWESVVENSAQANVETKKYGSLAVGFSVFITQFVTVGMVVWGVHLIAAGELTMGGLIGSNILAGRAMAPLMQMAGLITRYQNSRISLDALNMLMALPSEDRLDQATVDFGPLEASFSFENVAFSYPGVARTAVEGLSLKIHHGEKVGVIGRMGSGKSTLIRLLIGLYQPKEGAVKFGGVDLRQLAGADLRSRVGFAPQDTVLFYGTVRDNIVLGDPYINDQRMLRAASLAGVTDFIRTNPEGFGAQVGEQGRALSGGQRQAIGLARSLVRDPEVLILDEPTSNMDTSSEQAVQARLQKIIQDKTLILVTHRMSMLRLVDRLIVMDGGRIVADGPKDIVIQKLRASSPAKPPAGKDDEMAA